MTQAVAETTRTEVAAQTEEIRQATHALQQQVADINRELEERRRARADRRTSVIQDLRDGYSFDTVASALEQANEIKGLWHGAVTVPAGPSFGSPRVRIFWGEERLGGRFSTGNIFDDAPPAIVLSYEVPHDEQASGYKTASIRWRHGQTAGEALDELITDMQTAGHTSAAARVGSEVFSNLADALEQALSARAGEDDGWITGPLDEWIADGWAVTESGLESRDGGLRIPAAAFPDARFEAVSAATKEPPKKFDPDVPDDVDPDLWACAVERSRYKFKGSQSASIASQGLGPKAYTSKWNPRRDDWPLAEQS
ncbi:hypothetical protein [Nocardioides pocheonensis]|uniref:hypothetical protein n=1 Tax=Nocardioides pocheonensis TaxID=661485 RepID=UPI00160DFAF4|nr:hypothetical protein [Nocardioides pocheonensis]